MNDRRRETGDGASTKDGMTRFSTLTSAFSSALTFAWTKE